MDPFGEQIWATWLGLAGLLVVAELMSLDLVLIMLAAGAASAGVAALVGAPLVLQILVGVGVSAATLAFVRPTVLKRLHGGPEITMGPRSMIGMTVTVDQPISASTPGKVLVNGEIWTARPLDERESMDVGDLVDIYDVQGSSVHVVKRPDMTELG
ncbi:NfeD family protein [Nocardioidaceae bacterium]|nr:NfeD family protein [Nocardioidaceae bacterium]